MKRIILTFLVLLFPLLILSQQRGLKPIPLKIAGKTIKLYEQSHALIIGISTYTNGWPNLPGVKKDVVAVKAALEQSGFNVLVKENLSKEQMDRAFVDFIGKYGQGQNNRLLFYFAGHGHTVTTSFGEVIGYVVPTDAPNPNVNQTGFMAKSMPMSRIEEYAKLIQSKHGLFLFDACFSGSLFALTRAAPEVINYKTSKPVRQFITSGSEDETVPDESIFRKQFVSALTTLYADANNDGYLTGTELGKFLQDNVINYSKNSQHPQYGKIRNPYLDKGDFVFVLRNETQLKKANNQPEESGFIQGEIIYEYGSISIDSKIGGSFYLDGKYKGTIKANTTGNKLTKITTGTHKLKIIGNETWEKEVTVNKNEITYLEIDLPSNKDIEKNKSQSTTTNENRCISGNCMDGEGVYKFANGDKYEGIFKDGRKHHGKLTSMDGWIFEGEFIEGELGHKGKFIDPNGNVYIGEFKDNKKHGKGTMTYKNGKIYEGDWIENRREGYGKYIIVVKGKKYGTYTGPFNANKMEGRNAKMEYASGKIYVGEYKDNRANGMGKETSKGNVYEGPFVNGKKQTAEGQTATYTFAAGHVYVGEYKANKREGQGKLTLSNGDVYEGAFANNKYNGQGTYTAKDGSKKEGNWVDGQLQE